MALLRGSVMANIIKTPDSETQMMKKTRTTTWEDKPVRYFYIDIGCFDGTTIDYFLHFIPHSAFYHIIIFEPDPENYQLCQSRLTGTKYQHINITIQQQVVWIRDGKVLFQIGAGKESQIEPNQTSS